MERKFARESRIRRSGIQVSRGIFIRIRKRIWRRRQRISRSSKTQKNRIERKDNKGICAEVSKDIKEQQV